ncbi:PAS domain S-box protein [Bradyrhizobium erythrophlei]|jgi:PAS domain S-box-containing protein|uniref:histidine kinase n=1 Tax=Bradyrhizobium erythrophlei TaxID=1437360 RepID=A0A1M5V2S9_9BRAD|nr:PAS domain S-box protein [Bradyrhizobium erythrophlei]SHH69454.1 PAS domain S-box-containing protein [Bradyrhizobium erythrophlei]
MAHRDPSSPTPMPTILRYGIAVLSVAIAIGLGSFLQRHVEIKLTPFLFAVAATVWYAGTGPGVLAIVLSVLSLNYFFLRPFFFFSPISDADLVYLTFCTICALAVGWVSDVRRRAEQELRQAREELEAKVVERTASLQRSEGYLAEAQSLSHTGSWVLNIAARETIHWSQETYRLYGFDPEEGIPPFEALLQRIHPEDRGRFVDDLETAIRERANHEMIFRAVLPDGTLKYILGIGHPVFNASGDVVEFVAAAMDITERKRAEVVGQRLAAIVDSSEDAIISKDLNGTIESWNGAAERLFGYQASEVIGKSILIIVPPDRHDEELGILKRIGRGELIKHYETVRMREDGSLLDLSLTVSPLRDAAGRIIGASKIARDITERKRAEAALRDMQMELAHANRVATIGQLSASITHEVKQPIATAVTYARAALRFLARRPPELEEVREALEAIVEAGHRTGEVVDRIRGLIKKAPPRQECLDINAGIREVIEFTRGELVKNGISIQADLADGLPLIEGDRVQLQQVILNLIVNAIEAMSGASDGTRELLVSSRKAEPGRVLVGVRDSGPGLAPETLDHVFDAFYTTKPGGLGMGLSICRSIIEAHSGRLWASANLPRGASFQFALPAIANTASLCCTREPS